MAQAESTVKTAGNAILGVVLYVSCYVIVSAVIQWIFTDFLPSFGIHLGDYLVYVNILLAVAFGWLIISGIASVFYYSLKPKYSHPTAVAARNVIRIIGIDGLAAAMAGGVAGGAAGVALGGFLGIVIGFATQQVLGQAVAGLFLLIARPFRICDSVIIAGEDGNVEDVTTLFTMVKKSGGVTVLVPNNECK